MLTNDEIEMCTYEHLAKLIVNRCDTPDELRAAIAKTLEQVAMWADGEARKDGLP